MIHELLRISCSRNPKNIRNPPCSGYFLMFYGSQSHAFSCKHEKHNLLTLVSSYCFCYLYYTQKAVKLNVNFYSFFIRLSIHSDIIFPWCYHHEKREAIPTGFPLFLAYSSSIVSSLSCEISDTDDPEVFLPQAYHMSEEIPQCPNPVFPQYYRYSLCSEALFPESHVPRYQARCV